MSTNRDKQLTAVLVEFARTLGTDFSIQKILDHLVLRIADILPVTGAGVMLMGARNELHFVAASNDVVQRIEGLQNELGEGPCLEAYRRGQAVAISDLGADSRFPCFSPRARAEGLAAVFTFPLRLNSDRLGALDLYRSTPGPLNEPDMEAAQVLADVAAAYLFNAQGRINASVAVAQSNHRSLHDPLTGLPNRTLIEELLEQAVARSRRSHSSAAVLFLDLDGFKGVNDRYGHFVGDELLCAAAKRLTAVLRPGDTLARLGGDEFVVLCEDLSSSSQAETVAERITSALGKPFEVGNRSVSVTASVGVAFSGPGQDIPQSLLRDADLAMYQAKSSGGGRHHLVDRAADAVAHRNDTLERDLQQASRRNELRLVYQPIVDVASRRLAGVEALLRWMHPARGVVLPNVVIPSAERNGLILPLGEWVLQQACTDLESWRALGIDVPCVAVNVSAQQVMGPSFPMSLQSILEATGADPAALSLEVTESVLLADEPRVHAVLNGVKDLGVALSLDDFGTGYSSLSYLRRFPFDAVKIDRSFTANLPTDRATRSITSAMIDLSHVLDLTVVAEGVETARELSEVEGLGADQAQGFHFSRPLAFDEFVDYASAAS